MEFEQVRDRVRGVLQSGLYDAAGQAEAVLRAYLPVAPSERDWGMALEALAEVLHMQGRMAESLETFGQADHYLTQPFDRMALLSGWARAVVRGGAASLATRVASELRILLSCNAEALGASMPWGYVALVDVSLLTGDYAEAELAARKAVSAAGTLGVGKAEAHSSLSVVMERLNRLDEAMEALEIAMENMRQGHCLLEARARYAALALRLGDVRTATRSLACAVEFPDLRDRIVLAKVMDAIGRLGDVDPVAAVRCMKSLSAHLNQSVGGVLAEGGGELAQSDSGPGPCFTGHRRSNDYC